MSNYAEHTLILQILNTLDLGSVTSVHLAAFPDSALTKLGRESVRRYYEWQLIGPHDGVNVGAFIDGELAGFCFGGIRRGALGGFLERNRAFLISRILIRPWLLLNPLFRQRAQFGIQRLFGRLRPTKATAKPTARVVNTQTLPPAFGILSIAVDPSFQRQGVARLLMEYSENEARNRGFTRMHLTVHPSNTSAVRFYEEMGWQRDPTDKIWDGSMSKMLTPVSETTANLS